MSTTNIPIQTALGPRKHKAPLDDNGEQYTTLEKKKKSTTGPGMKMKKPAPTVLTLPPVKQLPVLAAMPTQSQSSATKSLDAFKSGHRLGADRCNDLKLESQALDFG